METLGETPVSLLDAARDRYIHYALSVIHARALPDLRDGLKPVQRRILYAMHHNLNLGPQSRYRKSAAVVGEVMAKYHPHGDSAIYEAMCRMAQDFSLLHPLVDGQGNFGSLDGDNPAAMRYTEARLRPLAEELLSEIGAKTVDYRPSYDGQHFEPVVLPAQVPNLLVNGAEGIAVGMATRIPPHNLGEVLDACLLLLEKPESSLEEILEKLKGPDFPTRGEITSTSSELMTIYQEGQGTVKLRATITTEIKGKKSFLVATSVPYGVVKGPLVEKLGEIISQKKIPQLVDVRDESAQDVRIVLELRHPQDAVAAQSWLYRHTALSNNFHVNLTCLVPTDTEVGSPARLDIKTLLNTWLEFRTGIVRRRLTHELEELNRRIHLLTGLARIFDALDECIQLIRSSEGKKDAANKLIMRFGLDEEQTDAILELKLYRLAKLELLVIQEELAEKQSQAQEKERILNDAKALKKLIRKELLDIKRQHGQPRLTQIVGAGAEVEYDENAYILAEDTILLATRDGWIKRQASVSSIDKIRVREGDAIQWAIRASTPSTMAFITTNGGVYVMRADSLPATTGHGEPVQRHFAFADRELMVGIISMDTRNLPEVLEDTEDGPYLVAITREGRATRVPLLAHKEISNKNGRRLLKLEGDDTLVAAYACSGSEYVCMVTREGQALCFPASEIPLVRGAAKGVNAIDLKEGDSVVAFELSTQADSGPAVISALGLSEVASPERCLGSRATKGKKLFSRKSLVAVWKRPPELLLGDEPAVSLEQLPAK
jgi:DNA gyrase subunit A